MSTGRPLTSATVIADHAARVRRNPAAFVTTLLRSRSKLARDILAHLASDGAAHAEELVTAAASGVLRDVSPSVNPELLGQLATVMALQGPEPDTADALSLFSALWREYGPTSMRKADVAVFLQILQSQRQRSAIIERLRHVDIAPSTHAALTADLSNPALYPSSGEDRQAWLRSVKSALNSDVELRIRDGSGTLFDRLEAATTEQVQLPSMITVITSAYNPDETLLNTARSLIAQSWQNWEMLIVDDASTTAEAHRVLRSAERLDPRIRVIRKAVNGGTYRARNTAILQARGEFVTCLDSDDWAHPDRLLRGVVPMLNNAGVVATRSQGARVSPDLEITRPGYKTLFPAASSLMFRLHVVGDRIGFFEPVRKGADTEYTRRLEIAFKAPVLDVTSGALTVLRADESSLSAAEFAFGWRHPARWAYKQSYGKRHEAIRSRGADPFVEPDVSVHNFGIARWWKPHDVQDVPRVGIDVIIAGDWRRFGGPQISMLEEIEACRHNGLRVGVLHIEAMRFFTARDEPLCEPLRQLLADDKVTLVHLDDAIEVPLLLLRYPPILQFPPAQTSAIKPGKVRIIANQAPAEKDGSDQRYVPRDVHRNAAALFGVAPRWVPQSPRIRNILEPLLPRDALADWDNPAIINLDAWWSARETPDPEKFTVGRFSRDDVIKFPKTGADLRAAYDFASSVKVVMMGAKTQVSRLLADGVGEPDIPNNWTLLAHKAMPVKDLLAELDVVLYMDHPDAHEAFGRSLLESAASGVLVVASPKHRATFGDALVYAEPHEAVSVVERYLSNPAMLQEQLKRSRNAVHERWSHDAFIQRLAQELPERSPIGGPNQEPGLAASGIVKLRRWRTRYPDVRVEGDGIDVFTIRVPRFADAQTCDYLTVVHSKQARSSAEKACRQAVAAHRPGWPVTLPKDLPVGVLGLIWDSGEWTATLASGCRADVNGPHYTVFCNPS